MKIATIAALALTLALPSLAQQSATKIVTENGQPTLALDEQFAARLRSGRTEQNAPATVPSEFSAAAPGLPLPADANHAAVKETAEERNRRMEWWRDAKFGMFIHYGLYSGLAGEWKGKPGGSEWIQKNGHGFLRCGSPAPVQAQGRADGRMGPACPGRRVPIRGAHQQAS